MKIADIAVDAGKQYTKVLVREAINFQVGRILGTTKPTLVTRGLFRGYSLPIYDSDDEELFSCRCMPESWDGNAFTVILGCWITGAEDAKNFKLQVSWAKTSAADVVPATTTDVETQTATGASAAQYTFYKPEFTVTASGVVAGDSVAFRIRRIAASADEVGNEIAVEGAVMSYYIDKLGGE